MEFQLTEDQRLLQDSAQRYLAAPDGGGDRWQAFAEMGWLALALPEPAGGLGQGAVELALLHQALGHALVVEPVGAVATLGGRVLCGAGPAAFDDVAAIAAGRRCFVLADAGNASAQRDAAGRWRLSGRAGLLHGGPRADAFVVHAAQADGTPVLLRVDAGSAGLLRADHRLIDGSASSDITLDGVSLPPPALLCSADAARHALADARAWALVAACAESLGVMERAFEATREHLLQRHQFGVAIASFQALRHRLADMAIAIEQARGALHAALAALHDADAAHRARALALAKARVGRSSGFVGAQAIQLHGGMGMSEECIAGRCFKRLLVLDQWLGGADAQLAAALQPHGDGDDDT